MFQNRTFKVLIALFIGITVTANLSAQGYLHTQGKQIVNGEGDTVILRGIGTGNWMLQEGYMMKTVGIAGTQHEFREKLIETIGEVRTDSFYNTWLENNFSRTDVDSMKAWGFNSVRVAMHYIWFTLPIEEEPVTGENTWLDKGFVMLDSVLEWCRDNEMYLILDLHAAPGGQGVDANISDYDPSKPSLWESQENKDKTVALWRKLAERYANESWIGGYDLINETNWTFPEGNNSQLREIYENITEAIREVDPNHIVFIEGNSFANDHSGLTPPWDDNLVYSFHKYWSSTGPNDLDWILSLRDSYDVPLWLGESGENSNTWFTDVIRLCETNDIGWSWWPVKKNGINNVLYVSINKDYEDLIKYWKGEIATAPGEDEAFQAVMQWAENQKIENCIVQYDVIDALIRQPHSDESIPFREHNLSEAVFFTDFDLGKNSVAYNDNDVAYYGGEWTAWNSGWGYRNDGVDIEICNDTGPVNNGYNVGWTEDEEWMQYSLINDSLASYTLDVRSASGVGGALFHLELNDADITKELSLPATGGWQNWETTSFQNIVVPAGELKMKFKFNQGGSNLNYFAFRDPQSADDIDFQFISAETSIQGTEIYVALNKAISTLETDLKSSDFELLVDGKTADITDIRLSDKNNQVLTLLHGGTIRYDNHLKLSYNGTSVKSGDQNLAPFSEEVVTNNLPDRHTIPGRIEAEAFDVNNGLVLENCSEGGKNTGYANAGDYLDYRVYVGASMNYDLNYRIATERSNAELILQTGDGEHFTSIDTIKFSSTGGWQNWTTQSRTVYLEEGYYIIRLLVKQGEHNLNWFEFKKTTGLPNEKAMEEDYLLYPNPGSDYAVLKVYGDHPGYRSIRICNMNGQIIETLRGPQDEYYIDTSGYPKGIYFLRIENKKGIHTEKLIIR